MSWRISRPRLKVAQAVAVAFCADFDVNEKVGEGYDLPVSPLQGWGDFLGELTWAAVRGTHSSPGYNISFFQPWAFPANPSAVFHFSESVRVLSKFIMFLMKIT